MAVRQRLPPAAWTGREGAVQLLGVQDGQVLVSDGAASAGEVSIVLREAQESEGATAWRGKCCGTHSLTGWYVGCDIKGVQ